MLLLANIKTKPCSITENLICEQQFAEKDQDFEYNPIYQSWYGAQYIFYCLLQIIIVRCENILLHNYPAGFGIFKSDACLNFLDRL